MTKFEYRFAIASLVVVVELRTVKVYGALTLAVKLKFKCTAV